MSDTPPPEPTVRQHTRRISLIWLIPLIALAVAAYLAWQTLSREGPTITITFRTADGLEAGRTPVKHKAVQLGTVDTIRLSEDMTHVIVRVNMTREAAPRLTDHARFWVVRPRFSPGNISGLETLVSGAYIEMDPGAPGGRSQRDYVGLEEPPGVRSDEPGQTFTLKADRLGGLGVGAPVFFHDIAVGEVLNYELGNNGQGMTIHIFVRAPYDGFVHQATSFWNASGLSVQTGAEGIHLQMQSLQAVLSGGVAFDTPPDAMKTPKSAANATFTLYKDENTAKAANARDRILFLTYIRGSVRGLAVGSPVEFYGIRVGSVSDMQLQFDRATRSLRVAVQFEVEPDRFTFDRSRPEDPMRLSQALVQHGMRVQLRSGSLLTGQLVVALDFFPNAPAAEVSKQGDRIVLPAMPGGLDSITTSLSDFMQKLDRLPLEEIGNRLNSTVQHLDQIAGGPDAQNALHSVAQAMESVRDLMRNANEQLGPALRRLPAISANLDQTLARANRVVGSVERGYGDNSTFQRQLQRLMDQLNDTARSIRLLADFLDRHPEALIRGRAGEATER